MAVVQPGQTCPQRQVWHTLRTLKRGCRGQPRVTGPGLPPTPTPTPRASYQNEAGEWQAYNQPVREPRGSLESGKPSYWGSMVARTKLEIHTVKGKDQGTMLTG